MLKPTEKWIEGIGDDKSIYFKLDEEDRLVGILINRKYYYEYEYINNFERIRIDHFKNSCNIEILCGFNWIERNAIIRI